MANPEKKPSDFNLFCVTVHAASATEMDIEQYLYCYGELLQPLFWNHDIDTPMAIERQQQQGGLNG
jgi:hypothetical protein